jgi:pyruvate/2-oxoglutarate dehydrogenase complex dihydrolipoamide dehydrogenase (E3) component
MKSRVIGKVPLLLKRKLVGAAAERDGVALTLGSEDGRSEAFRCDHVIAATGFRTDVSRLGFLSPSLRRDIVVYEGTPVLSATFESSVPGLYFIGPAAAVSFGPMMRFTFGARYAARRVTRALVAGRHRTAYAPSPTITDTPARTRV